MINIRPYRPDDTEALYEICLRTVDAGKDGTLLYPTYPELPGHLALGANLRYDPDLAFVVQDDAGEPIGYVVGSLDSRKFYDECERDWWPPMRERYPDPAHVPADVRTAEQRLLYAIHHPAIPPDAVLDPYPSHLHINLMPAAQAQGLGRQLLDTLFVALRAGDSSGVFLGVPRANTRAIGFYHHIGFREIPGLPVEWSLKLGLSFDARPDSGVSSG